MPLRRLHPRYFNWLGEFLSLGASHRDAKFWLSPGERDALKDWDAFKERKQAERLANEKRKAKNRPREIHARPIANWKKQISREYRHQDWTGLDKKR
jgi:hypothetical protein